MTRPLELLQKTLKAQEIQALAKTPAPTLRVDNAAGDVATVYVYGPIGASFYDGVDELAFVQALANVTAPVLNIRINSGGGDVFAARAMTAAVKEFSGEVVAYIDGWAASAASWLALSADKVVMNKGGLMMIHQSSTFAYGNARDFAATLELLNKLDGVMAEDYAAKAAGLDVAQVSAWMAAETWFTAQEALDNGLVDSIAEARPPAGGAAPTNLAEIYAKAPTTPQEAQDELATAAKANRDRFANYLKLRQV